MYLQVAVISAETQSFWLAQDSRAPVRGHCSLTEEAMALIIEFTLPLFQGVEASVKTVPKATIMRTNGIKIDR